MVTMAMNRKEKLECIKWGTYLWIRKENLLLRYEPETNSYKEIHEDEKYLFEDIMELKNPGEMLK